MNGSVSMLSMVCMALAGIVSVLIPVVLLLCFRKKKGADLLPFFVGCGVMLVFALILESAVHQVVLLRSPAGDMIQNNIWLYALYGGLMAGLFEETGRLVAFKTLLRRCRERDENALMYGAGHGGFEAVALVGVTMINNLVWSVMINTGNESLITGSLTGDALAQARDALEALVTTPAWQFLLSGVERIFAVVLQISLSVLVWFGAKKKGRLYLYPLAILIHALVDGVVVILSRYGLPAAALELVVALFSLSAALLARWVWRDCREEGRG